MNAESQTEIEKNEDANTEELAAERGRAWLATCEEADRQRRESARRPPEDIHIRPLFSF
jgi:hypothetical protein